MEKEILIPKIKEIISEFLDKSGLDITLKKAEQADQTIFLDLEGEDAKHLIGERGEVLFEIEHLLKAVLRRKLKERFYINLDIAGYRKKKDRYLRQLARSLAQEVALTKTEKELPPMPPAERRIIHLELASMPNVTTQSIGKEPNRRVIIQPYP